MVTKDWHKSYKIVNIFNYFFKAATEFLTYEESVPLLRNQCAFKDYEFYQRDLLVRAVEYLPDVPL